VAEVGAIRAVIFDFGGVIVPGSPQADAADSPYAAIERDHGLEPGFLWRAVYLENPDWMRLRVGEGCEDDWQAGACQVVAAVTGGERAAGIVEAVFALRPQGRGLPGTGLAFNEGMIELLRRLRGRYRVGLLSNAAPGLEDDLREHYGIYDLFDDVINSATVRMAKPDARIFALAAERHGIGTAECFFTDDLPHNVEAARAAGMTAHQFAGYAGLAAALRDAGIDPD
jgi:putative hydrolase of the HAD superfamily